jgi:ribose 5-phosphate isomerase B
MRIALGSDHRGIEATKALLPYLQGKGHDVVVYSDVKATSVDYPDYAYTIGKAVSDGTAERGILVCGTGIGMSIAANKVPGVRAALAHDVITAEISRRHNDANVLCLSGDMMARDEVPRVVDAFLQTPFEGGRHERRVRKIAAIERGEEPNSIGNGA